MNPITEDWSKMMEFDEFSLPKVSWADLDQEPIIPEDTIELISEQEVNFNDGRKLKVQKFKKTEYELRNGILFRKITPYTLETKTKISSKKIDNRKNNRVYFGDAAEKNNQHCTTNIGLVNFIDPNAEEKETNTTGLVDALAKGLAKSLLKRKMSTNLPVSEPLKEKNIYIPPSLRNKQTNLTNENVEEEEKSTGVKVDNIPYGTTIDDLKELFGRVAKIRYKNGCWINDTGSFAFVNFNTHEDALKAVDMINGHIYGNLYLNVELSRPRKRKNEEIRTGYKVKLAQDGRYSYKKY